MSLPARLVVLVLAFAVGTSPAASLLCARTCHGALVGPTTSHAPTRVSTEQHAAAAESCHEHARMRSSSGDAAQTLTLSLSRDARTCDHEPVRLTPTAPRSSDTMRSAAVAAIHAIVFLPPASLVDGDPNDLSSFDSPSPPRAVRPAVLRI
jgi:hypothetical protein